jgi:hypothetical protein
LLLEDHKDIMKSINQGVLVIHSEKKPGVLWKRTSCVAALWLNSLVNSLCVITTWTAIPPGHSIRSVDRATFVPVIGRVFLTGQTSWTAFILAEDGLQENVEILVNSIPDAHLICRRTVAVVVASGLWRRGRNMFPWGIHQIIPLQHTAYAVSSVR